LVIESRGLLPDITLIALFCKFVIFLNTLEKLRPKLKVDENEQIKNVAKVKRMKVHNVLI